MNLKLMIGQHQVDYKKILIIISIFYVFFFPTSIGGNIVSNMWMVRNLLACGIALALASSNIIDRKAFVITFAYLLWLTILTCTTSFFYQPNDFRIAYASISGLLPTLLIWCTRFNENRTKEKFAVRVINIISAIISVWGWCLVTNISIVYNFTKNVYSQLSDDMFDNMLTIRGKPVMSFGTHSMAAFFIMIVFFYNCMLIKEKKHSLIQYVFLALLFALEIPLSSNTAVLAMAVMLVLFVWSNDGTYSKVIALAVVLIGVGYAYYNGSLMSFVNEIFFGTDSEEHGIVARYFSGTYEGNFYMTLHYIGVGFLRSASNLFRMNDSGIVYLFTQGNVPAVIMAYYLMIDFLKRNLVKYWRLVFGLFFIWEIISASTFISVKMVFAHILTIYLLNSICSNDSSDNIGLQEVSEYEGV